MNVNTELAVMCGIAGGFAWTACAWLCNSLADWLTALEEKRHRIGAARARARVRSVNRLHV